MKPTTKLQKVSRRSPCPICEKPDWCGIADDGSIAFCMRISDGATGRARNGAFIHLLRDRAFDSIKSINPTPEPPAAAPVRRRNVVYRALGDLLELSDRHAVHLSRRGLSDLSIQRNGYVTLPRSVKTVCKICSGLALFDDLRHVPGFFTDHRGEWRFVTGKPGFLIPVRDAQGLIQAFQIRRDVGDPRYVWLSSAGLPAGASSGAPVHFARPELVEEAHEAVVTEGPLKADVIAEKLGCCVVGVPGVSSFAVNFGSWLTFKLPGLRRVLIAYDSDWRAKPPVKAALARLLESVREAELEGVMLDWSGAKGLDDLLVKEVTP